MIQTYSHTFKFLTQDSVDKNILNYNILSIEEEDANKHFIQYTQYQQVNEESILLREVNISVDRLYYLEIANASIDDEQRREKLFSVMGKRCFGSNDNKLDPYLLNPDLNSKEVDDYFRKNKLKNTIIPIEYELIENNINQYLAYCFSYKDEYFVLMKQTNISVRKLFEKTFLIQTSKIEHKALLSTGANGLKIEFIFNIIGKMFFKSQPLIEKKLHKKTDKIDVGVDKILIDTTSKTDINSQYLEEDLLNSLKIKYLNLESAYFNLYAKAKDLVKEPNDEYIVSLFSSALSEYIVIIENEKHLKEIISFFKIINTFTQEMKLSYLFSKSDQDIQDIFLFLLETITAWNFAIQKDIKIFSKSTIDMQNALKYFISRYLQHYHEFKCQDSLPKESKIETKQDFKKENNFISAREYFDDIELDTSILEELKELDSDLENYLLGESIDIETVEAACAFFEGYTRMLNILYEFKELGYTISLLKEKMLSIDLEQDTMMIMILLQCIVKDLVGWKKSVFIDQDAEDIHYIDKSFYANVAQIDVLLSSSGDDEFEGEIDFF